MTVSPTPRELALDATAQALNAGRYWLPTDGQAAVTDAVAAVYEAELDTARRRAVTFQARLEDARLWARKHLPPDQQYDLLAILGGREAGGTRPASSQDAGQAALARVHAALNAAAELSHYGGGYFDGLTLTQAHLDDLHDRIDNGSPAGEALRDIRELARWHEQQARETAKEPRP